MEQNLERSRKDSSKEREVERVWDGVSVGVSECGESERMVVCGFDKKRVTGNDVERSNESGMSACINERR